MKIETVTAADIRKDLTLDGDGFNVNVDGKFNIHIKRKNTGYIVDVWVGDTCIDTTIVWNDVINDIMEDANAD